jgi:nitrogen regulatory protein PII 2
MKTVIAIIRINMMNETKKALSDAGIPMMTAIGGAYGRGKGLVEKKIIDAASENIPEAVEYLGAEPRLRPQRVLYVTVSDHNVETTVNTIIETNQTGEAGDGKIFVVPEVEAIQVRTGVSGSEALD